jgi:hypothetical protein
MTEEVAQLPITPIASASKDPRPRATRLYPTSNAASHLRKPLVAAWWPRSKSPHTAEKIRNYRRQVVSRRCRDHPQAPRRRRQRRPR